MTHPAPNSELTSESVNLLKAGDVLRHEVWGVAAYKPQSDPMLADDYYLVGPWTFIGRPDADGWIPHDGGPNPVPGCVVDYRMRDYDQGYEDDVARLSDALRWDHIPDPADIIAFRLAAPDMHTKPAETNISAERVKGMAESEQVAGARERLLERLRAPSNWLQQPRGVDYKSVVSQYDRAPFEAADEIQRQGEENERLRCLLRSPTQKAKAVGVLMRSSSALARPIKQPAPVREALIMGDALKPCPHCGSKDIRIGAHPHAGRREHQGETVYSMCCYDCGATFPNRYRRELLVEAWNRRNPDGPEAASRIAQLEAKLATAVGALEWMISGRSSVVECSVRARQALASIQERT